MFQTLKAQAGKLVANSTELYTLALITIGIPGVVLIYFSWKEAVAAFVITQIALGILSLRQVSN